MGSIKKIIAPILAVLGAGLIVLGIILSGGSKAFNITFDSDGGSIIAMQTVKEGEKVQMPPAPTKDDYTFVGWELDNKEYDFTKPVDKDLTLKAKWEKVETIYRAVFVFDGEEKEINVAEITSENISSLGFPEKKGYTIKWYVDGQEYDFSQPFKLSSDTRIEGKYVKVETQKTYTVKFDSQGGDKVSNQTVNSGETVTKPDDITKEAFIFEGWYLNNKEYDFTTPVTKNITLVAKWKEDPDVKRYVVKFDSDGGSKISDQRVIENKTATEPKKPTKTGYSFVEWQLDNKKYDFKTKVTKDITLKAIWVEDVKFTVTFDSNGGSNVSSIKVNKGDKVTKPKNPTKSGHTFDTWLLNNSVYDFNTPVTADITLVARYTRNPSNDVYKVVISQKDNYSPDSILKVTKNNQEISFRCIKFTSGEVVDGSDTCQSESRSSMVAMTSDIKNETSFKVVLTDGTTVNASK